MSHNNPIPKVLRTDFIAYMRERDDKKASPAMRAFSLQDAVTDFCKYHKLGYIDAIKATSQYLRMVEQ